MRLQDRVAIVTGAGGGIGRAIAIRFSEEGAQVVVNGRREENITSVAGEIMAKGYKALHIKADVSNLSAVQNMVDKTLENFGRIDIFVNNAGILAGSPIESVTEEEWDKVINTNLKGYFLCSKTVGQEMIKAMNGNIINIASIAAHQPYPFAGAYSTTKAGIFMFTKQLAIEWAKYNIRVNGISPGLIRTPMTETQYEHQETHEKRIQMVPLGRIGTPEDIANTAVFLASDESSYITGQVIVVDGGLIEMICQYIPRRPAQA